MTKESDFSAVCNMSVGKLTGTRTSVPVKYSYFRNIAYSRKQKRIVDRPYGQQKMLPYNFLLLHYLVIREKIKCDTTITAT